MSRTTPVASASTTRPWTGSDGDPASGTRTLRPAARCQCRGWLSGRSTPGEETSSVYGRLPITSDASSLGESSRLTWAASSRPTPWSLSTTIRSSRRRPALVTLTDSRSMPSACSTGRATFMIWSESGGGPAGRSGRTAESAGGVLPGCFRPLPRPAPRPGRAGTWRGPPRITASFTSMTCAVTLSDLAYLEAAHMAAIQRPLFRPRLLNGRHRGILRALGRTRRVPDSDRLAGGLTSPSARRERGGAAAGRDGVLRRAQGAAQTAGPFGQRADAAGLDHRRAGPGRRLPGGHPALSTTIGTAGFIPQPAPAAPGPAPGAAGGAAARDDDPDPVPAGPGSAQPFVGQQRGRGGGVAGQGRAERRRGAAGPAGRYPGRAGSAAGPHPPRPGH